MGGEIQVLPLSSWGINAKKPIVIAGPCSVENETQIWETIQSISAHCHNQVQIIRAGIWKPRTRPNMFEGVGEKGLPWIKQASAAVGLPVAVEVASPEHVERALKHKIDILWIGARTTVSPFAIQEIANALKGTDIPLMIKNPINPDIELWIGAIERFTASGVKRIAAVHRGFSMYEKTIYRNPPMWEIPIELRRRYPELPIIVDPSHIGGARDLIYVLSQQAMSLGFDGLMIESSIDPDKALTDAKQQITPWRLAEILSSLPETKQHLSDQESGQLNSLRDRIDIIDDCLIDLINERMVIAKSIGEVKKEQRLTLYQPERWTDIVNRAIEKARKKGLSDDFILKLFQQIHNESIHHQTKVTEQSGSEIKQNMNTL